MNLDSTGRLRLEKKDNSLFLHYQPKSENVLFDLCDMNGKIYLSGEFGKDPFVRANLQGLPRGNYLAFIIDEGEIISQSFQI